MRTWYKIVEKHPNVHVIKTLFHGVNGSRVLELNRWLEADIKMVHDGSPDTGTSYLSGWHILPSRQDAEDYLEYFKLRDTKHIVPCYAREVWPKEHSRSDVYLAKYIKILD